MQALSEDYFNFPKIHVTKVADPTVGKIFGQNSGVLLALSEKVKGQVQASDQTTKRKKKRKKQVWPVGQVLRQLRRNELKLSLVETFFCGLQINAYFLFGLPDSSCVSNMTTSRKWERIRGEGGNYFGVADAVLDRSHLS